MSSSEGEPVVLTDRPKTRPGTLVFWTLAVLAVAGVAAIWLFVPQRYTATSIILVDALKSRAPMQLEEQMIPLEYVDRMVQDQIVRTTAEGVLQEALKSSEVMRTQWYAQAGGNVGQLLEELKKDLKVYQLPKTEFLSVSFTTRSAEDAPKIVNTVVEKCIVDLEATSKSSLQKEWAYYRDQTAAKLRQLRDRRTEKTKFITDQFRTPGVTDNANNVVSLTYHALSEAVTKLEAEKLQFKAAFENLKGLSPDQICVSPPMQALIEQDSQIAWLSDNQLMTEIDLKTKLAEVGENDPAVKTLRARLEVIIATLVKVRTAKEKVVLDYQIKSAETAYLNATQAEMQLRDRLASQEAIQADLDRKMAEYRGIEEDVKMLEEEYNQLNQFTNQLGLLQGGESTGRVRQISVAQKPSEPDWSLHIAATVLALAVPLAFGILLLIGRWISARRLQRRLMREAWMRWLRVSGVSMS